MPRESRFPSRRWTFTSRITKEHGSKKSKRKRHGSVPAIEQVRIDINPLMRIFDIR